jgi:uncharacterized protein
VIAKWIESHGRTAGIVALLLTVIVGTSILAGGLVRFKKLEQSQLRVTGYAETFVKADTAEWRLNLHTYAAAKPDAYGKLNADLGTLKALLLSKGLKPEEIKEGSLSADTRFKITYNGYATTEVEGYDMRKAYTVRTQNIAAVQGLTKEVETLVGNGMDLQADAPQYLFSQLDSLKLELISNATKNAKERATTMTRQTGDSIGTMLNASSGVFQITSPNSTDVSDYGMYDTSTVDKKITSVVNITFSID